MVGREKRWEVGKRERIRERQRDIKRPQRFIVVFECPVPLAASYGRGVGDGIGSGERGRCFGSWSEAAASLVQLETPKDQNDREVDERGRNNGAG